jgi:flavin-dependent dehydrogenase
VQVDDQRVKWLVGADGLHSMVRRAAGLELEGNSSRFGVRRHYALAPWSDRVEVYWSDVGEAYVTPVGPDSIGVAILFDPPGRFDELLGHFPELQARLAGARATTEDRGAGPFGQRASSVHEGNVFLVGDAAGYVDALTGEGIAIGVASGRALVDCLSAGRPERYPREWSRATRLWRWSTRALLVATRRRAAQRMIIRFLKHIPGLFDFVLRQLGGNAIVAHQTRP